MSSNSNSITVDTAKSLLSMEGMEAGKAVKAFTGKAAREFERASMTADTASGRATEVASIATYVAEQASLLPQAGPGNRAAEGQYSTKDWAALFVTSKAGSKVTTVSPTQVPLWRTLGRAIMEVGVPVTTEPDDDGGLSTWRLLAFRGAGGIAEVKTAVESDDATPASVREACLTVRNPDGSRKATGSGGKGTPRQKTEGKSTAELIADDPAAVALSACEVLSAACKAIPTDTDEGKAAWAKVESAISAILSREVTLRTKVAGRTPAKRAASKRATKAA